MRSRLIEWVTPYVGETLAPIVVPDQPVLSGIGGTLAVLLAVYWSKKEDLVWWKTLVVAGVAIVVGLVFGRLGWAATRYELILERPLALIDPYVGGAVSFGALFGAVLGAAVALRLMKLNLWRYADVLAPPALLGIAFARLGCMMRVCDYGVMSNLPWAVRYPDDTPVFRRQLFEDLVHVDAHLSEPVHPFPLYLALWNLACLGFALLAPRFVQLKPGLRAVITACLYAVGRFSLEFIRWPGNAPQILGPLNLAHIFALASFTVFAAFLVYLAKADTGGAGAGEPGA